MYMAHICICIQMHAYAYGMLCARSLKNSPNTLWKGEGEGRRPEGNKECAWGFRGRTKGALGMEVWLARAEHRLARTHARKAHCKRTTPPHHASSVRRKTTGRRTGGGGGRGDEEQNSTGSLMSRTQHPSRGPRATTRCTHTKTHGTTDPRPPHVKACAQTCADTDVFEGRERRKNNRS